MNPTKRQYDPTGPFKLMMYIGVTVAVLVGTGALIGIGLSWVYMCK